MDKRTTRAKSSSLSIPDSKSTQQYKIKIPTLNEGTPVTCWINLYDVATRQWNDEDKIAALPIYAGRLQPFAFALATDVSMSWSDVKEALISRGKVKTSKLSAIQQITRKLNRTKGIVCDKAIQCFLYNKLLTNTFLRLNLWNY